MGATSLHDSAALEQGRLLCQYPDNVKMFAGISVIDAVSPLSESEEALMTYS